MELMSSNNCKHSIGYHIVFCPKYRHQVLNGVVEIELKHVISETCVSQEWILHSIEVMPDHVHIFVQATPFISPVEIAQRIKSISAVYIFTKFPNLKKQKFWGSGLWSKGTFYATVGHISEEAVKKYIESQKSRNSSN